ncbi:MAG: 3'(2'),5'-bisphosphate nucleotidase CysQ [Deltaproteobacteria bacterium]|nr:3'(2'),5'-bisphosphate nucleotidase CysQ [Deltaproteobacteria bacterium]
MVAHDDQTLEQELQVALALANKAGAEAWRIQKGGKLGVELKDGDEPVTVADRLASEMIVAGLTEAFPSDQLISEELTPAESALGSQRLWLIDPIDGTKDFIIGSDGFAVMIGLCIDGRPKVGVVHMPAQDRTYWATPKGAFVKVGDNISPLQVSNIASSTEARLVASKSHRSDHVDRIKAELGIKDELNIASVGAKLGLIAMAVRDLYVNPASKTKAWDTCGPEAILVRAGGKLTDLLGRPIDYTRELKHQHGLVASNGLIHDDVVARLAPMFQHLI